MKSLVIIVSFFLASCVFKQQAVELPERQNRPQTEKYLETLVKPDIGEDATISIGDLVLSYTKTWHSAELVLATAPDSLEEFPKTGWVRTHQYPYKKRGSDNLPDYLQEYQSHHVYTNPAYYHGDIGAVLDSKQRVVLFVQVQGIKSGRSWQRSGKPFFGRVPKIVERWKLRYSGRIQSGYKFEIVLFRDEKAVQSIQSFEVSEESFLRGFVVRRVLIKGTEAGTHGTLSYRILNKTNDWKAAKQENAMTQDGLDNHYVQDKGVAHDTQENENKPVESGSGFVVSHHGHVLTNHHVIDGCTTISAPMEGRMHQLTVVGIDARNDLAVLKLPAPVSDLARFRAGRTIRPGDDVVVVGFPLHGLLASEANVTTGAVSALAGIGNDTRFLQITAPVQTGNSGGPVLDESGHIVGIVVSKLNAIVIAKAIGDIPQNINFAIKDAVAKSFLDSQNVEYETAKSSNTLEAADIGTAAKRFTLLLECHN